MLIKWLKRMLGGLRLALIFILIASCGIYTDNASSDSSKAAAGSTRSEAGESDLIGRTIVSDTKKIALLTDSGSKVIDKVIDGSRFNNLEILLMDEKGDIVNGVTITDVKSSLENNVYKKGSSYFYEIKNSGSDILKLFFEDSLGNKFVTLRLVNILDKPAITFLIYMGGDSDLNGGSSGYDEGSDAALVDINEIEKANVDKGNVNVYIFADIRNVSEEQYKKQGLSLSSSGVYKLENHKMIKIESLEVDPNTGSAMTLKLFLDTVADYTKPTKGFILDFWGHGMGWQGVGFDADYNQDGLDPLELRGAIKSSKTPYFLAINFSACLMMNLEVIHCIKDCTDMVCGAPEYIPGNGTFYGSGARSDTENEGVLEWLSRKGSEASSIEIATAMVDINFNSYKPGGQQYAANDEYNYYLSYSAVDTSKFEELSSSLKALFVELKATPELIYETVTNAKPLYYCQESYGRTIKNKETNFIDLPVFLQLLKGKVTVALSDKIATVLTSLDSCLIDRKSMRTDFANSGISIFLPTVNIANNKNELALFNYYLNQGISSDINDTTLKQSVAGYSTFPKHTGWDTVITNYTAYLGTVTTKKAA